MRVLILSCFWLLAAPLGAASFSPTIAYDAFLHDVPEGDCRARVEKLDGFRHHFDEPAFRALFSRGQKTKALSAWLAHFSSDALVAETMAIEQRVGTACPLGPKLERWVALLQHEYLARLGVKASAEETPQLFRGLLFSEKDLASLKQRVRAMGKKAPPSRLLAKLFGESRVLRGVLLVGQGAKAAPALEAVIERACGKTPRCPFWDPAVLYKVAITDDAGIAAFLPELGLLAVSRALLSDEKNLLHEVVLLHELTHAAEWSAAIRKGEDWTAAFSALSGWEQKEGKWNTEVREVPGTRDDALTRASKGSAFSMLPDPIYGAWEKDAKARDGFVLAKSYRASRERDDPSEDLADHVAVFRLMPERYCFDGKAIAPGKYAWIKAHLFPDAVPLACPVK